MKKNKLKFLALTLLATFIFTSYKFPNETTGKTVTIEDVDQLGQLTYITKLIDDYVNSAQGCVQISDFIDKNVGTHKPEILDNILVKNEFSKVMNSSKDSEVLLSELKAIIKKHEIEMVDSLCTKEGRIYITLFTYVKKSEAVIVATWDNEKKEFSLSKPLTGLTDFFYVFVPYGLNNNRHLFRIGYGDAGHYWWIIKSLDPKTNVYRVLEKCRGNFVYDEGIKDFSDDFEMRCAREYKPIKKHK